MSYYYYQNANGYPAPPPVPRTDWSVPPPPVGPPPGHPPNLHNHTPGYNPGFSSTQQPYLGNNQSARRGYNFNQGHRPSKSSRLSNSRRYNNPYPQAQRGNHQHQQYPRNNWNNYNNGNKKPPLESTIAEKLRPKKKKKRTSVVLVRQKCTMEEAIAALNLEKDYNKRHKNQSLIIKFPDPELDRDVVSQFHPSIENVHFQQPSTARFCFVTLKEPADPDTVISALNKVKFGEGYLKAEYKRDKEDHQNVGPEDIDPFTLYVGNLSKDITKEDMVKAYPKYKRIDIGFAQKMRFTRYAFVSFENTTDSMEAFKNTYSTQMYSKSIIVRFKRTHGSVGMPGEPKPQNPCKDSESNSGGPGAKQSPSTSTRDDDLLGANLTALKQEPQSSDEETGNEFMHSPQSGGDCNNHVELETGGLLNNGVEITTENIKTEKSDDEDDEENYIEHTYYNDSESEDEIPNPTENFATMYSKMVEHVKNISSLNKTG